jgi:hypothetical protein
MIHWRQISTAEKIEAVKSVWRPGMSASQIAENFPGVTRNSVIGLYGRYPDLLAETPLKAPTKSIAAMAKARARGAPSTVRPKRISRPAEEIQVEKLPVHTCGKPLMMLGAYQCRWPVNEASTEETHLFCAAPTRKTFCQAHHAWAFTKPQAAAQQLGEHLGRLG